MRGSSRLNVAYARAGAGMAIAALLATAAVAPVDVGSVAGPAPDDVEALEVATGQPLPVAYDDDGQPLPAEVGDPPVVEAPSPADELIARAERAVAAAAETPPPAKARPGEPDPAVPVVDEATLLVSFDDGTGQADVDAALASAGVAGRRIEGTTTVVVDLVDADRAAVTAALDEAPGVAKVEPNLVRSADRVPNDPQRAAQDPYLTTLGLPAAWDVADTGAKVTVAVLDTGVDLDHPDLAPNLVAGYNALQPGQAPADDNGHGTAVAGLIGAATNNGVGVAGVAWNARIMPVKVLDSAGNGTDVGVSQGIRWAVDHGADVINLSLGGPGASTPLLDAVDYAIAHDVVVVAASGNDGVAVPSFPAAAPGVLSVGATDVAGKAAWFSNHGPWVLLSAPGVAVRTTASGTGAATEDATGTSFSSPIVAGVAALLLERHPSWTWDSVAWQLLRTARDAGPAGADDAYGFGVVDAAAALGVAPVGPTTSPSTAGDAANLPSSPRVIPVGTTASEPFAYESDEDWLAFDVPALRTATVTVTPPAPSPTVRAAEMDPMLELYGPGGGLLASADATFLGQPEELVLDLEPGRHVLRVRNYYASASPAPYTVRVDLTTPTRLSHAPWATIVDTAATERSLVVADFSGDGRDDLAVTTSGDGTPDDYGLHVATQQADGTLGEPVLLPTHLQYPGADQLAAGDLDGDGDLDLALTTELGLDVAWNDGDGLTAPVLVPSEQRLQGIRSGDLEGDGRDELLVFTQDDLELVRWSGSEPTFTPTGIEVPSGPTRRLYDLGDVTGDGRDDLTVVDLGLVTVRPQQADGSWGEPVAYPNDLDDTPDDLTVDDVTGDGRDDVVMVGGGNGGWLTHLVQQPDGTLGAPVVLDSLDIPVVVAVGDVTGDGRPDAVATHTGYEGVSVYEQRPDGTLAPERLLPAPSQTWDRGTLSLGDLNGDGLGDVNYVPNGAGVVTIRQRYGVPTPEGEQAEVLAASPAPHATGVATTANVTVTFGHWVDDMFLTEHTVCLLNGRSGGCLPVTEHTDQTDPRRVIVDPMPALQPGTPYQLVFSGLPVGNRHVTAVFPFVTAGTPGAATPNVAGTYWPFRWDLGGDGYDDVVWFNPAAGTDPVWVFGPNGRVDTGTTVQGTLTPLAGDFDGNGYEDVFWYAPGTAVDTMWFDGPDGLVAQNFPVSGTYVPVVGDFDRNGYDDIFWYGPGTVGESVWRFRAGRQYTAVAQPAASATDYRIVAGDFDRDGYDDIVWHRPGTGAESLWRGGPTAFTPGPLAAANGNYQLRAGDADGDGYDDVYWFATGSASLWRGSAAGFVAQAAPVVGTGSRPVVGDFGADGRDDLLGYVPGAPADPLYRGKTGGW